jgi:hypothetical protein
VSPDPAGVPVSEMPFESPAEDVAEQRAEVYPDDDRLERSESSEVSEADAAEQAHVVPGGDDDYR